MYDMILGAILMLLFLSYTALIFYLGRRTAPKPAPAAPAEKELTPEQQEIKRRRAQIEDQFGKVFNYRRN